MLTYTIQADPQSIARVRRLINVAETLPQSAASALIREINYASQLILGAVTRDRFTGAGPFPVTLQRLGVDTGRLRRALAASPPVMDGQTGEITVYFGANVNYFAAHEFGFRGPVNVRAHTRQIPGGPSVAVRAHVRAVNIPSRQPMCAGLRDHAPVHYPQAIQRALDTTFAAT
jgi:hypothetical protein